MKHSYILLALLACLQLSSCAELRKLPNFQNRGSLSNQVGNYAPSRLDNDTSERRASSRLTPFNQPLEDHEVLAAQNRNLRGAHVTCTAIVKKLLPDDRIGNPHERFLIELSNGTTVLVAHNISLAPYVPLHQGDKVTVSGEYIWNEKGGVIHYTHHATNKHNEGGWIRFHGETYN